MYQLYARFDEAVVKVWLCNKFFIKLDQCFCFDFFHADLHSCDWGGSWGESLWHSVRYVFLEVFVQQTDGEEAEN